MPEPQYLEEQRLPASYANFYIANGAVLVPTFGCPADDAACGILGDCFPGRRVVPVDCRVLIAGLGALHCLTQQVPAVPASRRHERPLSRAPGLWPAARFPNLHAFDGRLDA